MRRLAVAAAAITAVGSTAAPVAAGTIADVVAASGGAFDANTFDYDILLNAVLDAGLLGPLADESAELTVFAPNDRAFIRLAGDLGFQGGDEQGAYDFLVTALADLGDPIEVLTDVLLYHVAPLELDFFDVILMSLFGQQITTLQGGSIQPFFFRLIDNAPGLRDPRLFFPFNVTADNGIVHTVNRVLIPLEL